MRPTPVVEKHYQLILWLLPKMANYPKDQRFLLADRTVPLLIFQGSGTYHAPPHAWYERILLDILEMLIEAVYSKDRRAILMKVNLKLDVLRFMMRLAFDMKYVTLKQYDFFCQSVLEVGRMTGGWLRASGAGGSE